MSLVDTDELRLMKVEECEGHTIEYAMGWKACVDWIKTLPTVPVVRCRECKHWYKHHCAYGICATEETKPDWFCADGERRANDGGPV